MHPRLPRVPLLLQGPRHRPSPRSSRRTTAACRWASRTHSPDLFAGDFLLNLASRGRRPLGALDPRAPAGRRPDPRRCSSTSAGRDARPTPGRHRQPGRLHHRRLRAADRARARCTPGSPPASTGSTTPASACARRRCRRTPGTWAASSTATSSSTPRDTADVRAERYGRRLCFDVSHSKLAANFLGMPFSDAIDLLAPHTEHLHLVDATGVDGEGVQVGDGEIDWAAAGPPARRACPRASASSPRSGRATSTTARASGSPWSGWSSGSDERLTRPPCGRSRSATWPAWPATSSTWCARASPAGGWWSSARPGPLVDEARAAGRRGLGGAVRARPRAAPPAVRSLRRRRRPAAAGASCTPTCRTPTSSPPLAVPRARRAGHHRARHRRATTSSTTAAAAKSARDGAGARGATAALRRRHRGRPRRPGARWPTSGTRGSRSG